MSFNAHLVRSHRSRSLTAATAALALVLVAGLVSPTASGAETEVTRRYAPFSTAADFVEQQYRDILRREPSTDEVAWQVAVLEAGREPVDLIAEFVDSAEANSNIKSIVRLYRAYYLRNPDHRGLNHWIQRRIQGAKLDSISTEFARSPEFAVRYGVLDDEKFVDFVYERVMRREPDATGRAYWLNRLGSDIHRGQFMTLFSESAEYVELTRFHTSGVVLYNGMFQRSIVEGRLSSLVITLRSGRKTIAQVAAEYLRQAEYGRRF